MDRMPIDIVYTWVDGQDPQHQSLRALHTDQQNNYCRYACQHELYYSLYSVYQFAPWVRKIFIVCATFQTPNLTGLPDALCNKITRVTQEQIMPHDALPVFNSMAIETCLHRIPDLSEQFIYFNDDTFLGGPVSPSDFFSDQGECYCLVNPLPRQRRSFSVPSSAWLAAFLPTMALYQQFIQQEQGVLDWCYLDKIRHQCAPCKKSILDYLAQHELFRTALTKTTYSAFRQADNIKTIPLMYLVGQFLQLSRLKKWSSEHFIMLT